MNISISNAAALVAKQVGKIASQALTQGATLDAVLAGVRVAECALADDLKAAVFPKPTEDKVDMDAITKERQAQGYKF